MDSCIYHLRCKKCNERYWRYGTDSEPDTNAWSITDNRGDGCPACGEDDWEVMSWGFTEDPWLDDPDDVAARYDRNEA